MISPWHELDRARSLAVSAVVLALLACAPGCYPHRSVSDLKAMPREQMIEFIIAAPKDQVDAMVPEAASRSNLNVEGRPANATDGWVLGRPIKLETAAFWVRVDTVAYGERTRVFTQLMLEPSMEGWTIAADVATAHFMLALTAVAQEKGVWK